MGKKNRRRNSTTAHKRAVTQSQAEQEAGHVLDCQDAPSVDLPSAQLPPPEQEAQQQAQQAEHQAQQAEEQAQQGMLQIAKHTAQ
jgi:hypothetical protein